MTHALGGSAEEMVVNCVDPGPDCRVQMIKTPISCSASSVTGQVTHYHQLLFPKLQNAFLATTLKNCSSTAVVEIKQS